MVEFANAVPGPKNKEQKRLPLILPVHDLSVNSKTTILQHLTIALKKLFLSKQVRHILDHLDIGYWLVPNQTALNHSYMKSGSYRAPNGFVSYFAAHTATA